MHQRSDPAEAYEQLEDEAGELSRVHEFSPGSRDPGAQKRWRAYIFPWAFTGTPAFLPAGQPSPGQGVCLVGAEKSSPRRCERKRRATSVRLRGRPDWPRKGHQGPSEPYALCGITPDARAASLTDSYPYSGWNQTGWPLPLLHSRDGSSDGITCLAEAGDRGWAAGWPPHGQVASLGRWHQVHPTQLRERDMGHAVASRSDAVGSPQSFRQIPVRLSHGSSARNWASGSHPGGEGVVRLHHCMPFLTHSVRRSL